MTIHPISRERQRQVETILRLYPADLQLIRLREDSAAYAGQPAWASPPPAPTHVGDPTGRAAVALGDDAMLAWARWRAWHVWHAYSQLPPDLRNVIALAYWHGGVGLDWREAARYLHVEQNAYYKRRRMALRILSQLLPPESWDLAQWLGVGYGPLAASE